MGKNYSVGKAIREIRLQKGISASFLARSVGIDPSTLSKYEHGERKVDVELLPTFAEILGVSVEKFFEEKIGETPTNEVTA